MSTYIALMRGINVGGHNKVKMAELKAIVEDKGFRRVETHIQSGNVIFDGDGDAAKIAEALKLAAKDKFGFTPNIIVRTAQEIRDALNECPFVPSPDISATFVHMAFLEAAPSATAMDALVKAHTGPEPMKLVGSTLYINYVNGAGRSRLTAAMIEKHLGYAATARNWNTVSKLVQLSEGRP